MKHLSKYILSAAIVATTLVGCSKDINEEPIVPEGKEFTLTLLADDVLGEESKTEYDAEIKNIKWSAGDEAKTYINTVGSTSEATITDNKAAFDVKVSGLTPNTTYTVQGVYPQSAVKNETQTLDGSAILSYGLELPAVQEATVNSFDAKADILIAKNMQVTITDTDIEAGTKTVDNFSFGRAGAISRYDFTLDNSTLSADETVSSVTISVDGEKYIAGNFYISTEAGSFIQEKNDITTTYTDFNNIFYLNKKNSITVTLSDTPKLGDLKLWVVTAPITLASGDKITFKIETDKHTITKTSTASRDIQYQNTKLNVGKVNLNSECEITDKAAPGVIPDGNYVIVAKDSDKYWAVSTDANNGKERRDFEELPDYAGSETYTTENAKIIWGITKVGSYYHITNDGKYLYNDNDTSTAAKFGVPTLMSYADLNISKNDDGSYKITKSDTRFLAKNGEFGFAFYTDDNGDTRIESLLLVRVVEDTTPKIVVAENTVNIDAKATANSIAYSVKNIEGTISATTSADWLTIGEISATAVAFTPSANYAKEERTATVTLSYDGAADVTVTVKQAGSTFEVTPAEVTIPAGSDEATFNVLSKEFDWTTSVSPVISGITLMADEKGVASENATGVTVMSDATATDAEQTLGTITVQRAENDPQAVTITVKKGAKGALIPLADPTITNVEVALDGFTVTLTQDTNATGFDWKLFNEKPAEGTNIDKADAFANASGTNDNKIEATLTEGVTYYLYVKSTSDNPVYAPSNWVDTEIKVPSNAKFVKVTSTLDDYTGTYLIVYESGKVAFDGSLGTLDKTSNTKSVTISNNEIAANDDMRAITFTIEKYKTGYAIKSASGKYIGQTSNVNGLKSGSTQYLNTISIINADANIVSSSAYLRYNANSEQERFRYFKSGSYTNQKAIQLYKLTE